MKLCDTCIYRNNVEQLKPCIIYRDNCEYYEKERDDMTREQAIKWLKDMLKNFDLPQEQYQTALDMAIKALEQEPCGDAILREDAIRTLRADDLFVCTGDKMQAISDIEGLSPVNPQEPKWILVSEGFPEDEDYVLVCYADGSIRTAYYYIDTESEDKE